MLGSFFSSSSDLLYCEKERNEEITVYAVHQFIMQALSLLLLLLSLEDVLVVRFSFAIRAQRRTKCEHEWQILRAL